MSSQKGMQKVHESSIARNETKKRTIQLMMMMMIIMGITRWERTRGREWERKSNKCIAKNIVSYNLSNIINCIFD